MLHIGSFSKTPKSITSFWRLIHPNPRSGFILGSGFAAQSSRYVYLSMGEPVKILRGTSSNSLSALRKMGMKNRLNKKDGYPRFIGLVSFEAGRGFDQGLARLDHQRERFRIPTVFFGEYRSLVRIDLHENKTEVISRGNKFDAQRDQRRVWKALSANADAITPIQSVERRIQVMSFRQFAGIVRTIKRHISAGDIYQANISLLFKRPFKHDPVFLFDRLNFQNPSPYASLFKCGQDWVVSCSPELLFEVKGRKVVTRPIAGTRPRGHNKRHDAKLSGQLLLSPKERAEHIMLVDLERNDLGRVCQSGSVRVTETMVVEKYSHVMHIVSQVEGHLKNRCTSVDVMASVFPGGTITGCPKIRSIDIIQKLEKEERSVFYGSAGYFAGNGDAKFNILIRTAIIEDGFLYCRAGAGIVADSHATREYREIHSKAAAILKAADAVEASHVA